jgi:hypothetical protein
MGHLTLMAVDITNALEKYPDDLLLILEPLLPQPAWSNYVHGPYAETQRIENMVLGGPRPHSLLRNAQEAGASGWGGDWNDDELPPSPAQEFKRGTFSGKQTADFGVANEADDDGEFHFNPPGFSGVWNSNEGSDEDEHEAWIKNSNSSGPSSYHSRDAEHVGFDDAFEDSFQPHLQPTDNGRPMTQLEVSAPVLPLLRHLADHTARTGGHVWGFHCSREW